MKLLIDKKKFIAEIINNADDLHEVDGDCLPAIKFDDLRDIFNKHTKKMVDEPHFPSGMDKHDIDIRNDLREELRNE